jgi:predicted dehydrogenase
MSTSRRQFLQASSVTPAALAAAGYQTAAAQSKSPNDRVRLACIGFGIMGSGDVKTAVSLPGVELAAVADVYEGRLRRIQELYGPQVFTTRDYREVLARRDIDAVIIATPDHWHARQAVDALNAGKDVYCQKPMVQELADGLKVIEAEKRNRRILQVGSQRVSSLLYTKARDLVKQARVGQIFAIEAFIDRNSALGAWQYPIPADASPATVDWDRFLEGTAKRPFEPVRLFRWRNYREYGTGIAGDLFVHLFTGIHYVMDSNGPRRVYASGGLHYWNDGRDVPDLMMGTYDYPQTAAHGPFHVSLRVNFEAGGVTGQGFRFVGTEGVIQLGPQLSVLRRTREGEMGYLQSIVDAFPKDMAQKAIAEYREKNPVTPPKADTLRPVSEETYREPAGFSAQTAHHANFIESVRTRKAVVEDATFGLRAAGPAVLSNTSLFEGRIVEWDPESMRVKA